MSFSEEWDLVYSRGQQLSTWPWSDLVSYVMRYAKPYGVLELGCGAGANIPFFKHLGAEYYGLDGSPHIIKQLQAQYPEYAKNISAVDFTARIPFNREFDLVFDRAALTHNSTQAIQNSIELIKKHLVDKGIFIGIDWFSTEHADFTLGTQADDANTRINFEQGQFKDIGKTHFSDKQHLLSLFKDFTIIQLEHKTVVKEIPEGKHRFASWNFAAQKK